MIDIKDAHLGGQYDRCEEDLRLARIRYGWAVAGIGILLTVFSILIILNS